MLCRSRTIAFAVALPLSVSCSVLSAAEPPPQDGVRISSALNVVGQSASSDAVAQEVSASGDFFLDVPVGPLSLHLYVEASSTPRKQGVFARLPLANADAGTALRSDDRGRVQVSELRLSWTSEAGATVHAGLMDLTGFLDVSRIANDENLFFLGQPFVNNPTIAFPDYVLGVSVDTRSPWSAKSRIAVSVSSSHGLADNASRSYRELFDLRNPTKGVFLASRIRWVSEHWRGAVGGWSDSSGERTVGGAKEGRTSQGVFTVLGWASGVHALNLRLGAARGPAPGFDSFSGLTYLWHRRENALGLGLARSGFSDPDVREGLDHAELFLRRRLFSVVFVTGSLQWLSNPAGMEKDWPDDGGVLITGIRLSASF